MANVEIGPRERGHPWAAFGLGVAAASALGGAGLLHALSRVNSVATFPPEALARMRAGGDNALFRAHPLLAQRIPWCSLGSFPTPVEPFQAPDASPETQLFVKRDDLSSSSYGGNKVRKLEFLLAEASLRGNDTLITLGGIGSNHALAVAMHGRAAGFSTDLLLYDQPVTPAVRRNLGGFLAAGARLHYAGSTHAAFARAPLLFRRRRLQGASPYFIMVGGSSRLGCLGYVSAAFELAEQVRARKLPEPDLIFVPLGTCGTAAGLVAGLPLAGLKSRVAAVRVADPFPANAAVLRAMAQDVLDFLASRDPSVRRRRVSSKEFHVLPDYLGTGYGYSTPAANAAIRAAQPRLRLEATYTGKTLAACIDHCGGRGQPETVLFWNTYSSAPVPLPHSLKGLPPSLESVLS